MGEAICWLNGQLLPLSEARISPEDRGLLYGDGLFETLRAYHGVIFRLGAHLDRLCVGARTLRFPVEPEPAILAHACREVLRANALREAYVRITVTRGVGGLASELDHAEQPTLLITARAFHGYPPEMVRKGMTAVVSNIRRNHCSPLARIKSLNYLENLLARAEASRQGADEALLLDMAGHVLEGSASNLFVLLDGVLTTPPVGAGVLPGITRACILQLCVELDLAAREAPCTLDVLYSAKEAFLTNSLMEVMPLVVVNGRPIGSKLPGPVTLRLRDAYQQLVRRETTAQDTE